MSLENRRFAIPFEFAVAFSKKVYVMIMIRSDLITGQLSFKSGIIVHFNYLHENVNSESEFSVCT